MTTSLLVFLGRLSGLVIVSATLLTGCGKQTQGERCSTLNGNQDCESGLVCRLGSELRSGDDVSRCCPADPGAASDRRCAPRTSGGSGGAGTMGGGGQAGEGPVSQACQYDSECPVGMKCGSASTCIPECLTDRDCNEGQLCTAEGACVDATTGAGGAN